MRVPMQHNLGKDEVRRRLQSRSHEIADAIPGGLAEVETSWPDEDRMAMAIKAGGSLINAHVLIEDEQIVFEIDLPPALSFIEPIIAGALRKKGQKLLAP